MSSELELSKQRITELEAENSGLRIKLSVSDAEIAELKRRNAEVLRANGEYNEMRDAEKAKLKARIEELESEFGDRITKVEQKRTLQSALTANDNFSNISSSNFNSVADQLPMVTHHEKPLVDKEMDTSLPEEPILEVIAKQSVSAVNISVMDQRDQTSLEDKETDSITQPCNSILSEASANSDGGEVPPEEKIGSEQDSKCKKEKSVNKLKQELFASELSSQEPSIEQNHVTEISETLCPGKLMIS